MSKRTRTQCKPKYDLSKKELFIIYTSNMKTVDISKPDYAQPFIEDIAGVFTNKNDAKIIANCLNHLFKKDLQYSENKYQVTRLRLNDWFDDGLGNFNHDGNEPNAEYVYVVFCMFIIKEVYNITKQTNKKYYTERIFGITTSREHTKEALSSMKEYFTDDAFVKGMKVQKYHTNDVKPTRFLKDYSKYTHKETMKRILPEIEHYPQKQKMKNVLENIELMKYAPPSKLLPKGGLGYRKQINDPEFIKRWAPWDPKFKK